MKPLFVIISPKKSKHQGWLLLWIAQFLGITFPAIAQPTNLSDYEPYAQHSPQTQALLTAPINLDYFRTPPAGAECDSALVAEGAIATDQIVCQTHLTVPSLWWTQEQFGQKLVNGWVAFTSGAEVPRRVDVLVNPLVWRNRTFDYAQRYLFQFSFLTRFGSSAFFGSPTPQGLPSQDYQFNTRVVSPRGELLAAYICESSQPDQFSAQALSQPLASLDTSEFTSEPNCQVLFPNLRNQNAGL
jgi:hypothetical protein